MAIQFIQCLSLLKRYKKYRIISNPGYYPTSIQIPLIPIIQKMIKTKNVIITLNLVIKLQVKNLTKFNTRIYLTLYLLIVQKIITLAEIDQEFFKRTAK